MITLVLLLTFSSLGAGNPVGISSKLNFGEASPSKLMGYAEPASRVPKNEHRTAAMVVCGGSGCNKTQVTETHNGTLEADVVVHVETSIVAHHKTGGSNATSPPVSETPDVPVIVGTAGVEAPGAAGPFAPNGAADRPYALFSPTAAPPPPSGGLAYGPFGGRAGGAGAGFALTRRPWQRAPSLTDGARVLSLTDGVRVNIPYFEPTYNKHYFGEYAPPALLYYPQSNGANIYNPVEFKSTANILNPLEFKANTPPPPWQPPQSSSCTCREHMPGGLQWHPIRRLQIDDKLAPLNDKS